jgi:hypothetical protein
LTLQRLPGQPEKVLILGDLAGRHSTDGWFRPADIVSLNTAFRLPPLSNPSQTLSRLAARGRVTRRANGQWSLTPEGRDDCRKLNLNVDDGMAELHVEAAPGADLGNVRHSVLPAYIAPLAWRREIDRFLGRYPFETNVFCMTRFPEDQNSTSFLDPIRPALDRMRASLKDHGLTMHLASDRQIVDDLWGNVAAHMWASRYGVAVFEDRLGKNLNYNLVIEVGAMLMTGRRCALLKDDSFATSMPTDFVGQIYKAVDVEQLDRLADTLHLWAADDLGLGRCTTCQELEA